MCHSCWDLQEKRGGYLQNTDKVKDAKKCQVHPTLDNWRVFRTLNTIKVWSLEHAGYRHPNFKGVKLVTDYGFVHRRTAEAVLFDYESPMIDFLVNQGYLKQHNGIPITLTVTQKGDNWIREKQKK